MNNVFILTEVNVGMVRTLKIYFRTKFAPIQTALMKSVYLDTPNPRRFGYRCVFNMNNICLFSHVTFASDDTKI